MEASRPTTTRSSLRADARRNRERVLSVARARLDAGDLTLQLNDIAREAGLGVGTVYRHFPTRRALIEALAIDPLEILLHRAREASAIHDPWDALAFFVRAIVSLQLADISIAEVLIAPEDETPRVAAMKQDLHRMAQHLLDRAHEAQAIRAEIALDDLQRLVCGIEHAVRIGPARDAGTATLYTDLLLAGIRA